MNQKKLIIALLILVLLGTAGYFISIRNRNNSILKPNQSVKTETADTSNWKIYRSEKYKFEIKYPPTLEALEGQALFYRPPEYSPLLNVCFASVNRRAFYCEVELYIASSFIASPQNLRFLNANSFSG